MEYLKDWRTWAAIAGIVLVIAEIGRVIFNHIAQKEKDEQAAKNVFSNLGGKKLMAFPFKYEGVVFIKAKNKFQANKGFMEFKKEQGLLKKRLEEKKSKSKNN